MFEFNIPDYLFLLQITMSQDYKIDLICYMRYQRITSVLQYKIQDMYKAKLPT